MQPHGPGWGFLGTLQLSERSHIISSLRVFEGLVYTAQLQGRSAVAFQVFISFDPRVPTAQITAKSKTQSLFPRPLLANVSFDSWH